MIPYTYLFFMKNCPDLLLIDSQQGGIKINPAFVEFNDIRNWSIERQVETFWKQIREHIFEGSWMPEDRIEKSLQAFTTWYELAKYKFQDIERNLWWRYFDHWVRVMQYLIQSTKNPSIRKVLIAILHDIIEDTNKTFWWLKEDYWVEVALWVLLISKRPLKDFLSSSSYTPPTLAEENLLELSNILNTKGTFLSQEYLEKRLFSPEKITQEEWDIEQMWLRSKNDFELFQIIDDTGILNSKWLISDEIYHLKKYSPEKINFDQRYALELFQGLVKKYKWQRNSEYFSHMLPTKNNYDYIVSDATPSLNAFFNYALSISSHPNLRIRLNPDEIRDVALSALEVKFWDRIDNLRTTEAYKYPTSNNIVKAERKLVETQKFFLGIAREFDIIKGTEFYSFLLFEIEKLKLFLKENIFLKTVKWVENVIKK